MTKRRIRLLEIVILVYLFNQIVVGIVALNINHQYYEQFRQKLLVKGEIIEMEYYNLTFPDLNYNLLEQGITRHFYNLTIRDYLTNSIIYRSLGIGIIEKFDIRIGNIIFIYKNQPFIEVKVK